MWLMNAMHVTVKLTSDMHSATLGGVHFSTRCSLLLFAEPEGYHFGAADGPGHAVWRKSAAAEAADSDDADALAGRDVDEIAFGFMTWRQNATLLHYSCQDWRHTLHITLASPSFISDRFDCAWCSPCPVCLFVSMISFKRYDLEPKYFGLPFLGQILRSKSWVTVMIVQCHGSKC